MPVKRKTSDTAIGHMEAMIAAGERNDIDAMINAGRRFMRCRQVDRLFGLAVGGLPHELKRILNQYPGVAKDEKIKEIIKTLKSQLNKYTHIVEGTDFRVGNY